MKKVKGVKGPSAIRVEKYQPKLAEENISTGELEEGKAVEKAIGVTLPSRPASTTVTFPRPANGTVTFQQQQ